MNWESEQCLILSGTTLVLALFRLLGLVSFAEPLLIETGAPTAADAGLLSFLHLHVSFLSCRHDFDVDSDL